MYITHTSAQFILAVSFTATPRFAFTTGKMLWLIFSIQGIHGTASLSLTSPPPPSPFNQTHELGRRPGISRWEFLAMIYGRPCVGWLLAIPISPYNSNWDREWNTNVRINLLLHNFLVLYSDYVLMNGYWTPSYDLYSTLFFVLLLVIKRMCRHIF